MNTFYALQPCWWTLDRFYKIYVTDDALYGAVLTGQVFDEDSASMFIVATSILAPLTKPWADRLVKRRREREEKYDRMDPTSQDFLKEDKHNFSILKNDLFKVEVNKKSKTLWTGGLSVSGILQLTTHDMRTRRFILVASQDAYSVRAMI